MADDNKRTGKVPASVYAEAHTPESLDDIRQKFGRKVKFRDGTEMRSTWYQPPALTSEPTNEMTKGAFQDHVKHAKRSPAATLDDVQKNRRGDETLRRYLKELGREPSSLKSVDWGAAERGKVYTTADLDMIRSAEGRKVVMPNGHVLQTTWYSNPSTAGLTEWEKKQIAKSEAEYLKQQSEKIAARTTAAVAPAVPAATPAAPARPSLISRIEAMKKPDLLKATRELGLVKADGKPFTAKSSVDLMRRYLAHEHRRHSTAGAVSDDAVHAALDKMSGKSASAAPLRGYEPAGERAGYKIYGQTKNPLTGRALPEPLMMVVGPDGKHVHFPRDPSSTGLTSNEKLAQFLNEKDGRGANNVASKPVKTVSAPRGMDGLTRAERKAKAGGAAKVTAAPVSTPAGASYAERFLAAYERSLTEQIKANPSRYAYGVDRVPEFARKMTEALATGRGDHQSPTVQAVAKSLGIKPTLGHIQAALSGQPPPAPRPQKSPLEKAEAANVKAQAERSRAWQSLQKGHISAAEWGQVSRKAGDAQKAVEALKPTAKLSGKLGMAVAIGSTALGLVSALRSSPASAAPAPQTTGATRTKPYTDSAGREYRNGRLIVRPST